MDYDEILYPPYPAVHIGTSALYESLDELRKWMMAQQDNLRGYLTEKAAGRFAVVDTLAPENIWNATSVSDKYNTLTYARRLRELWDHIVRTFEENWDSRTSVGEQYKLVLGAQFILREAFVLPEHREQHEKQMLEDQKKYHKYVRDQLTPPELRQKMQEQEAAEGLPDDEDFFAE